MKRPWKSRVWVYKPQWDWDWPWIKAWAWKITYSGGDEYDWHTRVFGFPWTGQIVVATKHCDGLGRCKEEAEELGLTDWPNLRPDLTFTSHEEVPEDGM